MAELGLDWLAFGAFSVCIGSILIFQTDGSGLLHIAIACLLCLGVTTFIIYIASKIWDKWFQGVRFPTRNSPVTEQEPTVEHDDSQLDRQRNAAREKLQEEHQRKAMQYDEKILKPRRVAKEREKEEQFYRFSGPAWKGEGNALGTGRPEEASNTKHSGTSKDAATARVLPESVTKPVQKPETEKPKTKRVITLPDEPNIGAENSITIALKTPLGRTHRRRFLITYHIQVLVDFMTKLGFHPRIYSICSTYPRQCLTGDKEKTLEELGLTKDVALVIEEKDNSTDND